MGNNTEIWNAGKWGKAQEARGQIKENAGQFRIIIRNCWKIAEHATTFGKTDVRNVGKTYVRNFANTCYGRILDKPQRSAVLNILESRANI